MSRWVLALLAASSCSGIQRVVKAPPTALELTTVFVLPPRLSGFEPTAARSFELSNRALEVAVREAGDVLAFYGPTEVQVLKPNVDNAWIATDALPVLVKSGSRADQGAVLQLVIERRVASSATQTESMKGQTRGSSANEETTWLVRAELAHPSSSTVLIEASSQVTVDPFAPPPPEAEWDSAPQLTALVGTLVAAATKHAATHAVKRSAGPAPLAQFVSTPALAGAGGPEEADAMQREIALQNRARVLAPTATEAQAASLSRAVAGAAVLVGDSKLQPLDVVLSVDERPALPHVLARLRFKGAPGDLEVKRAGGVTEHLVWP